MIPSGWRKTCIGEVSNVVRGASPRPAGSPEYFNGEYLPWITVADITSSTGMFLSATNSMLTEDGSKFTRIFEPDTLLLTNSGATLGVPKITKVRAGANDGVAGFLELRDVSREYLFFFLQRLTKYFREQLAPGLGQPNLNTELISQVPLLLPPPSEQTEIVSILQVWDRAIDHAERLIAEKRLRRKGLMQQLLTGKRRLSGFNGTWREVLLSELFAPVRRKNISGETMVLTASGEHGLVDQTKYFRRNVSGDDLTGYFLLYRGEFAYNRSSMNGYPYGAIKRLDTHDVGILSTLYLCFEPSSTECCSDFYMHLFEAGILNRQLRGIVQVGARAHGLLNVSGSDFFGIKVPLPSIQEQRQIAEVLNMADRELDMLKTKADALREQKKGLMQQLLTGKKRVKV